MMFAPDHISQLSAQEFKNLLDEIDDAVLLDVRSEQEYQQAHLQDARLINIHQPDFREQIDALDRSKTYLIYCRSGHRSAFACQMMQSMDFESVHNLQYGIIDWVNYYDVVQPKQTNE